MFWCCFVYVAFFELKSKNFCINFTLVSLIFNRNHLQRSPVISNVFPKAEQINHDIVAAVRTKLCDYHNYESTLKIMERNQYTGNHALLMRHFLGKSLPTSCARVILTSFSAGYTFRKVLPGPCEIVKNQATL